MTRSRFYTNARIMAVVAVLSLAAGSQTANAQMAVSDPATEQAAQIVAANAPAAATADATTASVTTALDGFMEGVNFLWNKLTTFNTGATGVAVAANGAATAQVITTGNQALLTSGYTNAVGAKVADQTMRFNTNDLAVTVCAPATLMSGFSIARAGVASILTETPPGSCAAGGTTMAGVGVAPDNCTQAFNPNKSTAQRITDLATVIQQKFYSGGNGSDPTDSGTNEQHADTDVNSFFKDRTFTQADRDGFRTFEDLICGLPPENTPKSPAARSVANGQTQLVNQHAQIAAFNLCVQTFKQYDAYHEPVSPTSTAAAIVSIYSASTGSQMTTSPALQALAAGSASMEELLHALYQGIPEGGDGQGANIFTQIAGLHDGVAVLKMIASELLMTNYMEYERKTIEQQNLLINSAILARLDRGGIIQR